MSGTWKGYRLVPEDVLFFRDGKPASMGEDHYLRPIFPPHPATLYGAVRTQRLLEEGCDLSNISEAWWGALPEQLRNEVGEWGDHGTLRLRGPWLLRDSTVSEILVPAPLDLQVWVAPAETPDNSRSVTKVVRLLPDSSRNGRQWSHSLAMMTPCRREANRWVEWQRSTDERDPKPAHGWFLTMKGIESWIAGLSPAPQEFVDSRALWSIEMRTGLGLQKERRTSQSGMLYTFGFIRMARGVSIGFEIDGGALRPGCHVRLGGENRLALLESGPSLTNAIEALQPPAADDGVFALMTAGIFDEGSRPHPSVSAAVVTETVRVGGWDLARRGPKPLSRAVPAGSVYYIDGAPFEQFSSLSKQDHEGFGLMLRGTRPRR
jgi:CRISPR-associated protein Cmr3